MSASLRVISYWLLVIRRKQNQQTTTTYNLKPKTQPGFTLIELMIAISIVAIISAVGLVTYSRAQLIARDAKRKQDLRSISIALELFYQKNKRYPCAKSGWGQWSYSKDSTSWITDLGACTGGSNISFEPIYINKIPMDPLANNSSPLLGGSGYGYAYWSGDPGAVGGCTPGNGQGYTLVARLENIQDADTAKNAGTKTCAGGTYYPDLQQFYRPEDFIIAK